MFAKSLASIACAAAFVSATGCAVDASDTAPTGAKETVASTSEALNGLIVYSWGGVGNASDTAFTNGAPFTLDLKIANGWTCWVSGVAGNVADRGVVNVSQNFSGTPGIPYGDWFLNVCPMPGQALLGSVVCAPATSFGPNGTTVSPGQFNEQTILNNATINQFCGLSEVFSGGSQNWNSSTSFATVSNNGLNPNSTPGNPTWMWSEMGAQSEATCGSAYAQYLFDWDIQAPASGSVTMQLGVMPAGTACFLSSITGAFTNNSFTDGVSVQVNSAGRWSMTASNGKKATATCIK